MTLQFGQLPLKQPPQKLAGLHPHEEGNDLPRGDRQPLGDGLPSGEHRLPDAAGTDLEPGRGALHGRRRGEQAADARVPGAVEAGIRI